MAFAFREKIAIIRLIGYGTIAFLGYQHRQEIVHLLQRMAGQPVANVVCVAPSAPVVRYVAKKSPSKPKSKTTVVAEQPDWIRELFPIGQ